MYGQFQDGAEYSFAESGIFVSSNEYILLCNNYPAKALLAFLNCSTIEWLLGITTGNLGGNAKIGQKSNFLKISIPHLSNTEQMTICDLVDDVLCHHNWSVEKRIDEYVYKHFNLSNDEINMIETAIQIQQNQ